MSNQSPASSSDRNSEKHPNKDSNGYLAGQDEATPQEHGQYSYDPEKPRGDMKQYLWVIVVVAVFSATFLFALDNTIVADIQPAILKDFGEINKLPWITVAFELGAVSVNLLW